MHGCIAAGGLGDAEHCYGSIVEAGTLYDITTLYVRSCLISAQEVARDVQHLPAFVGLGNLAGRQCET